jgi:AsmA protein
MGKLLKFLAYAIGGVVVLVIIAALTLPLIIDPNDYKGQISRIVKEKTGRDLVIGGDIDLSVFPWLALGIKDVRFSNAPGFGNQPFAEVKDAEVGIKLLPLLRKEVEMSTLVLDGLKLSLARNAKGVSNWDDLVAATTAPAPETTVEETQAPQTGSALGALAIGGVKISDAQLLWDDQASGVHYEIPDLDLTVGAIAPGQPVDVRLAAQLGSTEPPLESKIEVAGIVSLSEDLQQFEVKDLVADVAAQGEALPGGKLQADLSTQVRVDLHSQTLDLSELVLNTLGMRVHGQLAGTGISGDRPEFTGSLRVDEFVPRDVIEQLGIDLPPTSDPAVLGKADMDVSFAAGVDQATLSALKIQLDDSTLDGSAAVKNFTQAAISFDLALDEIDLDRYLPPQTEAVPPTPAEAAAGGAGALPVEMLRSLNLDGSMKIGKLKVAQLRSQDILVQVKAKDGVVRVNPARASMYQGSYTGDVQLDVSKAKPRISMNESLKGIQAGPLLKDLTGDDRLRGTADLSAKLTAVGDTPDAMTATLNGDAAFAFTNGAVKGINIVRLIRQAKATLKGKPRPPEEGPDETEFSELRGTATVTNGVVRNDDLTAMSPLLRVAGKGSADLPAEKLDYRLNTKIVGSLEGQGGKELDELKGLEIPVRIFGSFSEPQYKVDLAKVLEGQAKEQVEKQIDKQQEKLQEKLQDKLGDELGGKLKGLFGN